MDVPGGVPVAHLAAEEVLSTGPSEAVPLAEIDDVRADWHERPEVVTGDPFNLFAPTIICVPFFFLSLFVAFMFFFNIWPLSADGDEMDWFFLVLIGLLMFCVSVLPACAAYYSYTRVVGVSPTHAYAVNGVSSDDAAVRVGNAHAGDAALHIVMACYHAEPQWGGLAGRPERHTVTWRGRTPLTGLTALPAHPATPLDVLLPRAAGVGPPGDKPVRLFLHARGILTAPAAAVVAAQVEAYVAANRHRDRRHAVTVQLVMPPGWCPRLTVWAPGPGGAPLLARRWVWAVASAGGLAWAYELACRSRMDGRQLTVARTFDVAPAKAKGSHSD